MKNARVKIRVYDPINKRHLQVMQGTGFKDKHGVEIYECDIIAPVEIQGIDANVFYDDKWDMWCVNTGSEILFLYDFIDLYKDIVVIGNIYEN